MNYGFISPILDTTELEPTESSVAFADEIKSGLSASRKELPPKYFYDERGSQLFEDICALPEYYQTRTERGILQSIAPDLIDRLRPREVVELGAGSATKTRILFDALEASGDLYRYVPIDISREMLMKTAEELRRDYLRMEVDPIAADFTARLPRSSRGDRRLVIFLGGTIGNFRRPDAVAFLRRVVAGMGREDRFLLGIDIVKDPTQLHAAYNDSAGVTAEFNLNVLNVINRELDGEFNPAMFRHYAFYNPCEEQIEMHLASLQEQSVRVGALERSFHFERGETILTEISRKFSLRSATTLLRDAGLELVEFHTDIDKLFGLCLARPV